MTVNELIEVLKTYEKKYGNNTVYIQDEREFLSKLTSHYISDDRLVVYDGRFRV